MSSYQILTQVVPQTRYPWRVIEVIFTSDGPRSRIIGGAYETLELAQADVMRRIEGREE